MQTEKYDPTRGHHNSQGNHDNDMQGRYHEKRKVRDHREDIEMGNSSKSSRRDKIAEYKERNHSSRSHSQDTYPSKRESQASKDLHSGRKRKYDEDSGESQEENKR